MVPARPFFVAIVLAALAAGGGVIALQLASDHKDAEVVWAVFGPAVGWSFIGTGLYAWRLRPESRTGALMILLGFAWFVYTLDAANSRLVYTLARRLREVHRAAQMLDSGVAEQQASQNLRMPPWLAKRIAAQSRALEPAAAVVPELERLAQ